MKLYSLTLIKKLIIIFTKCAKCKYKICDSVYNYKCTVIKKPENIKNLIKLLYTGHTSMNIVIVRTYLTNRLMVIQEGCKGGARALQIKYI